MKACYYFQILLEVRVLPLLQVGEKVALFFLDQTIHVKETVAMEEG